MLKRIKKLLLDNFIIIAIGTTLAIICLSLIKLSGTGVEIKNIDKVYHSIAYFTLASTWLFSFYKKPEKKYLIVASCIIFGIIIELLQSNLTIYRTGDIIDVLANSLGAILALIIFNLFLKKKWIN
ncbi:VanZ family protein [Polaribacter vadi]|uniref:VanZ family protein n=1 Tax=Polaribacter TaxID=52959 RepID=UPI001C09E26B|nr:MULTISPECIES: VanZ family protein [Polaribacter]MBU3010476.1 VanZ family protein [Polaribacter vadi]MDO6740284.1 VanZ family protein [Polaribacter sp. 1_MG-2023]